MLKALIRAFIHQTGNALRKGRISFLRAAGVQIGRNCMLSMRAKIDVRRGKVVIGDNCTITFGCILLSHDRSEMYIDPTSSGEYTTRIGNNVYLGVGSIILPGVSIGDNSVIGAGSVVTKNIPACVVAVGNPAKVIKNIDISYTAENN